MAKADDPFGLDRGRAPRDVEPGKDDDVGDVVEPDVVEPVAGLETHLDPSELAENARGLLKTQGVLFNGFTRLSAGDENVPEQVWLWRDDELDVICPAIGRYASRHLLLARALEKGDLAVIAMTSAEYTLRNLGQLRAHEAAKDDLADVDAPRFVPRPPPPTE